MTVDMTTTYLGFELASPVMPSASPLTGTIDHILALVEAGAPAIVLPSLFEEQIEHDAMAVHFGLEFGADGFGEAPSGYLPELNSYNTGPDEYLELMRRARGEAGLRRRDRQAGGGIRPRAGECRAARSPGSGEPGALRRRAGPGARHWRSQTGGSPAQGLPRPGRSLATADGARPPKDLRG